MYPNTYLQAILVICLLLGLPLHGFAQSTVKDLPEMGDSSATLLSQEDEQRIGGEMMRQLSASGLLLNDPIVEEYIQNLGRKLASSAVTTRNQFQFFVVDAPSINAFAMPGGYIGVHSGLILASESESELAAVIAHEIAHVTQHHIARSVEKANQMNLPLTAAVIAAILLGGSDPQVANAALAASIGGAQQMQLDFTRANEKEADRVGMQLLAQSDYDPRGMSAFFSRLQSETRYYGSGVPEFLRTHPVTTSRIAEAEDRARRYPPKPGNNGINYLLVKSRLRLHRAKSIDELAQTVRTEKPSTDFEREAHQYLSALIQARQGNSAEARRILQTLLRRQPNRIAYIYTMAQLEAELGRFKAASDLYRRGLRLYPANPLLSLAHAHVLLQQKRYDEARELLETQIRKSPENAEAYRLLAELESAAGNKPASYLAQAEYYYLEGEAHSAIDQLNMAMRLQPEDYYASRIEARLRQIKEELSLRQ